MQMHHCSASGRIISSLFAEFSTSFDRHRPGIRLLSLPRHGEAESVRLHLELRGRNAGFDPRQPFALAKSLARSRLPNRAFWWALGGALSFSPGSTSQAREIFRFAEMQWTDLMITIGAAGLVVLCLEVASFARPEPPRIRLTSSEPQAKARCWSPLQGGRGSLPSTHCLFFLNRQRALGYIESARGW